MSTEYHTVTIGTRQLTGVRNKKHSDTYLHICFKSNTALLCNNHLLYLEGLLKLKNKDGTHQEALQGLHTPSLFHHLFFKEAN